VAVTNAHIILWTYVLDFQLVLKCHGFN